MTSINMEVSETTEAAASKPTWTTKRFIAGALPAAGITFGLFIAMNAMIGIQAAPDEEAEFFDLVAITPQIDEPDIRETDNRSNDPIEAAAPPPDLPPVTIEKVKNFIPVGDNIGKAPERIVRTGGVMVDIGTVNIPRKALPIGSLSVSYPPAMLRLGKEGDCEVRFDLNPLGEAFNIRPDCSDPRFERSARRAVANARFSPSVDNGKPVAQNNMIYPIAYRISEDK